MSKPRVLHFVTGGFSGGATQVAIHLVRAAQQSGNTQPMLVLRRKSHTNPARITELQQQGLPVQVVAGWSHIATIIALYRLCKQFQPDVLVTHGFSEHLWGRYAGLLAKVPALVHVEHNTRERYTRWRLAQTRWLAKRTAAIVGCSQGVRDVLLEMGMPPERTIAIPNGIGLEAFADAPQHPVAKRIPAIVMVARVSKQKDHATVIRALALLRQRGLQPKVLFAGTGKTAAVQALQTLAQQLGVADQVQFLGVHRNVPALLMQHRIALLSTHYEGMPLALLEGMAAGCAVIASAVPGVNGVIEHDVTGCLVPESDPHALADTLQRLLQDDVAANRLGNAARQQAIQAHSRQLMLQRYEALFLALAGNTAAPR